MSKPKLELVALKKEYEGGDVPAVDGIDLAVAPGETLALLGPSGCGKSTTLNMIVGLEEPSSGDIQIDGRSIVGVPAGKRNVGMVFQDYAVFTSMTVRKNLAFGLEIRKQSKSEIDKTVREVAELLDMTDKLDAPVRDMGGSELQRVAIGRTLATRPALLLLDEPLSNLEYAARLAMRRELRRLQQEIGLTIIYVTHDQIEALSLADRIAVMRAGRILQVEKTTTIYDTPDHLFVAGFLGSPPMNLLRGDLLRQGGGLRFALGHFELDLPAPVPEVRLPRSITLGLRPETLQVVDAAAMTSQPGQDRITLAGRVQLAEPRGPEVVLTVGVAGVTVKAIVPSQGRPEEGAPVTLAFDPASLVFFSNDTSHRMELF
ncbi:ABC transporter ATP-binding protein [Megalodesulfovibrio paquesii]